MRLYSLLRTGVAAAALMAVVSACSASDAESSAGADASDRGEPTSESTGNAESGDGGAAVEGDAGKASSERSDEKDEDSSNDDGRESDADEDPDDTEGSEDTDDTNEESDRGVDRIDDDDVPDGGPGQTAVLNQLSGNRDGACVDTDGLRNARSGGIAAGPFDEVESSFGVKAPGKPKRSIRVYWIPEHRTMPGLTVRVSKVGGASSTTLSEKSVSDTSEWKFYDTYVPIESAGTWRLEAESGQDRGCFTVTVGNS